jgi:hypothetical protein
MAQFIASLAGASFRPADVKDIIRELSEGDQVFLERDPDNQYDANAIKFVNDEGVFLGFVNKEIAAEIAPLLDESEAVVLTAIVHDTSSPLKPIIRIDIGDA